MVAHGRGVFFFAIAGILVLIAVVMPAGLYFTGTPLGKVCGTMDPSNIVKIWGLVLALALALCGMGGYYGSRRLILEKTSLRFQSWFHDQSWPLAEVAGLSYQTDIPINDTAPESYIAFWDPQQRQLTRISLRGWDIPQFQALLKTLIERRPNASIAPEVRRFLESHGAASGLF